MFPYGVCSDIHLHKWAAFSHEDADGTNSRLKILLTELEKAVDHLAKQGGRRLVITGDLFHVRGSIAPSVLNPTLAAFQRICQRKYAPYMSVVVLAGNHDLESKDSKRLSNACESLSTIEGVKVISSPTIDFENSAFYVPWIESLDDLKAALEGGIQTIKGNLCKPSDIDLFLHAPVNEVLQGMPDHGLDPDYLSSLGFRYVFCGHYHNHKEVRANVFSVGALTHQTWGDVNSKAGYLIVHEALIEHFQTQAPRFVDFNVLDADTDEAAIELCRGNYIRLRLSQATHSEIQDMREYLTQTCLAEAVVIEATPAAKTTARTTTVKAGASLKKSVADFITARPMTADKAAVFAQCEDILSKAVEV